MPAACGHFEEAKGEVERLMRVKERRESAKREKRERSRASRDTLRGLMNLEI